LKPILHKVWCFDGQRPLAPVQHRYAWRYLVGFVHPASGRTVFHLASTVNIALFEVELAEFARHVGAGPTKQIVLVLDRAGWHATRHLRVPEHVHLLFLPPYSPELQPAEHAARHVLGELEPERGQLRHGRALVEKALGNNDVDGDRPLRRDIRRQARAREHLRRCAAGSPHQLERDRHLAELEPHEG